MEDLTRKSPIRHSVRTHIRNKRRVSSYIRGKGERTVKRRLVKVLSNAEFYKLIGRIETYRNKDDFRKFKREFLRRFNRSKWIYRGMSRDEYEQLLDTGTIVSNGHFTLDFDIAKSWARGDTDVVVRILKPSNAKPRDYKLNDFYIDELEVLVPKGTKVQSIVKVFDKQVLSKKNPTKLHTPEPLMDVDRRVLSRLKRDPSTYRFETVPISQINMFKVWNPLRYKDNLAKLKATKKMPPVLLQFNWRTRKFDIEDGIHRINAAKDLNYTHVPAVVAYAR